MTTSTVLLRPLLVLCALVLAACGDPAPADAPPPRAQGAADTAATILETRPGYALAGSRLAPSRGLYAELQPEARLGLTTYGSSSSRQAPTRVRYDGPSSIAISMEGPEGVTTDVAPTTFLLQLDASRIDPAGALTVRIDTPDGRAATVEPRHVDRAVRVLAGRISSPGGDPSEPSVKLTGDRLAVTTHGSSCTAAVPVEMEVRPRSIVELWMGSQIGAGPCPQQLVAKTTVIAFDPALLDRCNMVEIRLHHAHQDLTTVRIVSRPVRDTRDGCPAGTGSAG